MAALDIHEVFTLLEQAYPQWHVPLADLVEAQTRDPFKVLVATVLSAQTRDSLTAKLLPALWERVDKPEDLARISEQELERLIYPVSYYRTKARHLKQLGIILLRDFSGIVPSTIEALLTLPGVGRKTANVVLAVAFNKPAIGVDTHVHRISNRLGYVRTKTRAQTEERLRRKLPEQYWSRYNTYLVALGQRLCHPTSPQCSQCPLEQRCRRVGVKKSR